MKKSVIRAGIWGVMPWFVSAVLALTLFFGMREALSRISTATREQATALASLSYRVNGQSSRIDRLTETVTLSEEHIAGVNHTDIRTFAIKSQMAQAAAPVVIIGDSITEGALLPSTVCGKAIINAGIGGASAETYGPIAESIFHDARAALIIVALGTNDSVRSSASDGEFISAYSALADGLASRADKIMFAGIPVIDMTGATAKQNFDSATADRLNDEISEIAKRRSIGFISLRSNITGGTVDGVHLNAAGYKPWNLAITSAIAASLGCGMTAVR